jgi:hypothetical protein
MSSSLPNDVAICNLALVGHLGKASISSFTQSSTEAVRCALFYPMACEEIAQASDWSFLRELVALSEMPNDLPEAYGFKYAYPQRALKLMYLYDPSFPKRPMKDYLIGSGAIYTNVSPAYARYITLEDRGPETWPLHFKKAVAAKVAELLAPGFTRRKDDVNAMRDMAQQELARAIENDASQEHTSYTDDETYVYGVDGQQANPPSYDGSTFWRR